MVYYNYSKGQEKSKERIGTMTKTIWFDMDGTIADLYHVKGWLADIRAENPRPYITAKPIYNDYLDIVMKKLIDKGYRIGIISYVAHNSTDTYAEKVTIAKRNWLMHNFPYADADKIHIVTKATPKSTYCDGGYLVDDEDTNLIDWENAGGRVINARTNIIWKLWELAN